MSQKICIIGGGGLGRAMLFASVSQLLSCHTTDLEQTENRDEADIIAFVDDAYEGEPLARGTFEEVYGPPVAPKPIEFQIRHQEPYPEYSAKQLNHPGFDGNYRGYFKRARRRRW